MQGPTTVSQATVDDVRSELRDLDSRETSPLRKLLILAVTLALFVSWGLLSSDVLPAPPPALSDAEAAGDGPPLIRSGFYASGYQVRARVRVARPNPKGSGQGG